MRVIKIGGRVQRDAANLLCVQDAGELAERRVVSIRNEPADPELARHDIERQRLIAGGAPRNLREASHRVLDGTVSGRIERHRAGRRAG
jgi:hypothetical protein